MTNSAAIITLLLSCSSRMSHPNAIPKIGVKNAKLAMEKALTNSDDYHLYPRYI